MATSINWPSGIINVPRADMTLIQSVPTEIRQLNLNTFRLDLKDLEDEQDGMAFLRTHIHNPPVTVGGVVLSRVVEIINGYTVTFEDGQYAVNLVGANSNVADITNVNQVSVRSANSAGLQDLDTLLFAAYNGEVAVDVINGQAGTNTPIGTRRAPVGNFADAVTIANANGIRTFAIMEPAVIATDDFSDGFVFSGDNAVQISVSLPSGANLLNCEFRDLTVSGVLDGLNILRQCSIQDLEYTAGFLFQCALNGTVTVASGAQASMLSCYSNVPGGDVGQTPIISLGGGGSLALRDYNGGVEITDYNGAPGSAVSIDMAAGRVTVASSVTGGTIYIRGVAEVEDNSGPDAIINVDGLISRTTAISDRDDIKKTVVEMNLIT